MCQCRSAVSGTGHVMKPPVGRALPCVEGRRPAARGARDAHPPKPQKSDKEASPATKLCPPRWKRSWIYIEGTWRPSNPFNSGAVVARPKSYGKTIKVYE